MRAAAALSALLVAGAAHARPESATHSVVPTDEVGRAWYRDEVEGCFARLASVLDAEGYSHDLALQWDLDAPSVVDATEARAGSNGADVTLLTDGTRIHVVAPFVSYARARALARQSRLVSSEPQTRICAYVRTLELDAKLRRYQRSILALIAVAGLSGAAQLVKRGRRLAEARAALQPGGAL